MLAPWVLAVLLLFQSDVEDLAKRGHLPAWSFKVLAIVLTTVSTTVVPFERDWEERQEKQAQSRTLQGIEAKVDRWAGQVALPTGQAVPIGGVVQYVPGLFVNRAVSLGLRYTPMSTAPVVGRLYLFDLYAGAPTTNRLSLYFEQLDGKPWLLVRLFDGGGAAFVIRYDVSGWKVDQGIHIAVVLGAEAKTLILYINGGRARALRIKPFLLDHLGPEVYFSRDYTGAGA
ncbi:MAG: hypothetical protein U0807_03440 [Candidatus Binatia bacterium]